MGRVLSKFSNRVTEAMSTQARPGLRGFTRVCLSQKLGKITHAPGE